MDTQDLTRYGIRARTVHYNLAPAELLERAVRRGEGTLTAEGSFVGITKPHTGRSPDDKFVVREPSSEGQVWWGKVNVPMEPEHYEALKADVVGHLSNHEIFVTDLFAGADERHRLNVRAVSPSAWHSAFVHNMFIRPTADRLTDFDAIESRRSDSHHREWLSIEENLCADHCRPAGEAAQPEIVTEYRDGPTPSART